MEGEIRYLEKRAEYRQHNVHTPLMGGDEIRWDFIFDSLGDLEELLRMDEAGEVCVDNLAMSFQDFERKMLSRAHRIYTSVEDYAHDMTDTSEFKDSVRRMSV